MNYPTLLWSEQHESLNATTPLRVFAGDYTDRDNTTEELQLSYKWYINGNIVENQSSNTLPPYMAVFGDKVEVSMLVSDGFSTVEGPTYEILLGNAPAQVIINDLPSTVKSGDFIQFQPIVTDPDVANVDATAVLISGPSGINIADNGQVSWTVPNDLKFSFQYFEFHFAITGPDGQVSNQVTIPVEVQSSNEFPIVASGLEVPKNNNSMAIGDFDGDGMNEILSTDSRNSVFLLEAQGTIYKHKWIYPFRLPSAGQIVQVLSANIDDDPEQEIIVFTEHGASLINGIDNPATLIFSTIDFVKFAQVDDLDLDGTLELLYLYSEEQRGYDQEYILDVKNFENPSISLSKKNLLSARSFDVANIDNDNNLEIIFNNGEVYDATTWEKQWDSDSEFGDALVSAGDYNGDGIAEIARAQRDGRVTIYSGIDKGVLGYIGNRSFCTLHSADVDSDGTDELLAGDCSEGNIVSYKLGTDLLVKHWRVNIQGSGSTSLITGDSDNDGKLEVHWGSGVDSSGKDYFASADIENETVKRRPESLITQLDAYSSAGWGNIADNQERAVFFIPFTQSGSGDSHFVTLDESGDHKLSEGVSSNWDRSENSVVADFNNDGFGDIFVPSASRYSGAISALQLSDSSEHWRTDEDRDVTIGLIKAADVNTDDFVDAIYTNQTEINLVDIENQSYMGTFEFNYVIDDFVIYDSQQVPNIVVANGQNLSFIKMVNDSLVELSVTDQSCSRVAPFNFDEDIQLEIVCLHQSTGNGPQQLVIFEVENEGLTEVLRTPLKDRVIDIVPDPSKETKQDLFFTTEIGESDDYTLIYDGLYQIKKSDQKGNIIWSSPGLVGKPTEHGLKVRFSEADGLEMMLSTTHMMYWIK
jgi:hypothetical protein